MFGRPKNVFQTMHYCVDASNRHLTKYQTSWKQHGLLDYLFDDEKYNQLNNIKKLIGCKLDTMKKHDY
jgi:hypothetical protein